MNPWVLRVVIPHASIGLDMRSAATVMRAMLIFTRMELIKGIAYAAAIDDTALLPKSSRNPPMARMKAEKVRWLATAPAS